MAELTMLAEMMDRDLPTAINGLKELGITKLDLKNHVFGRPIESLDDERRAMLAELIEQTGTEIFCFSSTLGHLNVSQLGEYAFRRNLSDGISNLLRTAAHIRPAMIRLLACTFDGREDVANSNDSLERHARWVYSAYRDAVDHIHDAGLAVTIENEPNTVFSTPDETVEFLERLDCGRKVGMTWDIQNMWQSGIYPTLEVYRTLKPVVNYVHLKGGQGSAEAPRDLTYRSPLADAGWPVREIVGQVLDDGVSPVICLNPSHGAPPMNYRLGPHLDMSELVTAEARDDVSYLREAFRSLA